MRRIVLMVLKLFYIAPYYVYRIGKFGRQQPIDHDEAFAYIQKAACKANRAGRVTIEVHDEKNIPEEKGFIFFPNHQGMFDILVFLATCPVPFSFVLKHELKDIILLKQVIAALGAIPMDRSNLRQSMQVISQMAEEVKKGRNFLIFAEGTRSKLGNKLLEFKGGSFKSAQKAKCPIVPCVLIDSFVPFDQKSVKPVTVKLYYLPPMYYDEYKDMKTSQIAEEVKRRIELKITEVTGE
ncbi:MAG: 1-acyl-sn-glycerol-3-phosphate acyltransferase [Lachnospiraceae bacterium]|nr:1-acyl-sn-glycerol-3-phosphate acyltransferase [Lachnospiraceae bacterium]MBR5508817.1 1-acyl-sn-glycerol-3-phosphate acyltransferase [Lachnospiraceae bacterium]